MVGNLGAEKLLNPVKRPEGTGQVEKRSFGLSKDKMRAAFGRHRRNRQREPRHDLVEMSHFRGGSLEKAAPDGGVEKKVADLDPRSGGAMPWLDGINPASMAPDDGAHPGTPGHRPQFQLGHARDAREGFPAKAHGGDSLKVLGA